MSCMMNPWITRGSIPIGAKDGDKNPKVSKGGRKVATTLLLLATDIRSMRGIYQQLAPAGAEDRKHAGGDLMKIRTSNLHKRQLGLQRSSVHPAHCAVPANPLWRSAETDRSESRRSDRY